MIKKVTNRDMKINYFEKNKSIWIVKSELTDEEHEINILVEIDMVQMMITDAKIEFIRYPLKHCQLIEEKASQLKGLKVDREFVRNAMKIFIGPQGCPNILTLLNISIPGIIYYYYPYKLKTGEMNQDQWENMIKTELKNDCLAHTLYQN